jgi:ORF6N domain
MESHETQTTIEQAIVAPKKIERSIFMIRSLRVVLDADLAALYGVSTKAVNQAIKRNKQRFPPDFMFRLTQAEKAEVVTNCYHLRRLKFSPVLPAAFTEHGAIMAATVLNSNRAIKVSLFVVRAFLKLREMVSTQKDFARKLEDLERKFAEHDEKFKIVFQSVRRLMEPTPVPPRRRIGFPTSQERKS